MPALPRSNRRRGVIPVKKVHPDDIWRRAMRMMGLEPITTTNNKQSSTPVPASKAPAPAPPAIAPSTKPTQTSPTEPTMKKLTILDLPPETQKEIIQHADTTDLIALSLVSKHFRDLAAEELYRSFNIVFPDEDDTTTDSSFDVLASGLETFVSSEYDYAQYLREIILEPLSGGEKGERAYRFYMNESSSGRFMNTLFLMMLRKARSLETFSWDIRIELTRPVFKALHQIRSLQHLRIRMQPGHSTYQGPPAISASSVGQITSNPAPVHLPPPPPLGPPGFGPPSHSHPGASSIHYPSSSSNSFALGNKHASKSHSKTTKALLPALKKSPPTLSGFKNLKSLEILDMDTLDYVGELRACIRNSSSTLETLALSFSETLAKKSRRPPVQEVHSDDDSEAEDEFGQIIPLGPANPAMQSSSADGQSKITKAQEEKKKQEDVLQKIFGIATAKRSKPVPTIVKAESSKAEPKIIKDPQEKFIENLAPIAKKLMTHVEAGSDMKSESKAVLKMIEQAAQVYMENMGKTAQPVSDGSSPKPTPATSTASIDGEHALMSGGTSADGPGLFDEPAKEQKTINADPGVSNPDDIDIEAPEADDLAAEIGSMAGDNEDGEDSTETSVEPAEFSEPVELGDVKEEKPLEIEAKQNEPTDNKEGGLKPRQVLLAQSVNLLEQSASLRSSHTKIKEEATLLKSQMEELREKMKNIEPTSVDYQILAQSEARFRKVSDRVMDLTRSIEELSMQVEETESEARSEIGSKSSGKMSEYVRNTRGLGLTTLAIYLIPIKAQILSRGVDLNVLQNITLLNVGPQVSFWNLLAKENAISPLPLNKIYTDNVTLPFLGFIHQLDRVTELLLLEKQKGRVETTAAKTTVSIEHIRKALRKHVGSLKVLMIRHDSSADWDLNVKATMMLCQQATELEELSVTFGLKVVHTLLQFISGLTSLRALHTNYFRQEDQCQWVRNNFGKFLIDTVSQNPQMKLEYLALDQNVERLVRRSKEKPLKKIFDKKGKGKAKSSDNAKALAEMILGPSGTWPDGGAINNGGQSGINMPGNDDWQLSSDEEEDANAGPIVGKLGLRVETIDGVRFCDVPDVRIFEKDVVGGRLW
ncbi:hypothetical protein HYALB_00013191 [Hymenoscyphus albidus]|uniref:F-box domain-containing protein n=1 Tax=Hymenoscyphus albidus TaxID=595503 RepID=A0A9N9Q630_9HELO|nr:hypothetical protein HYALB_00013191 [Hymenoscyphus albidus]